MLLGCTHFFANRSIPRTIALAFGFFVLVAISVDFSIVQSRPCRLPRSGAWSNQQQATSAHGLTLSAPPPPPWGPPRTSAGLTAPVPAAVESPVGLSGPYRLDQPHFKVHSGARSGRSEPPLSFTYTTQWRHGRWRSFFRTGRANAARSRVRENKMQFLSE
jgi:hypothetical protein